jgi:dipeptidyl aminopeptidase/acylaminoacyl peptidase
MQEGMTMPPVKKTTSSKKASQRLITAEDLYALESLSGVRLSPDGKHVVYTIQRIDRKTEKKYSNLWIVSTTGRDSQQFTYGDQNDSTPRWSPDGKKIAFLSNRQDKEAPPALFLIPFTGGEARQITQIKGSISSFLWSPDGKKILCTVRKMDPEEIERRESEQKKKLGVVARHYDRLFYKLDGYGYLPRERTHLWIVNVETGKADALTGHPVFDELAPTWTSDSKQIIFVSNRSSDPDNTPDRDDLFSIPAKGGEPNKFETPIGPKASPSVSPDGKLIAYFGKEGEGDWYRNTGLWIMPVDGSGPANNLLSNYDLHVDAATINDLGAPEQMPPTWSADSSSIYFQVVKHGSTQLVKIDLQTRELETIIGDPGVVVSFNFDQTQSTVAYCFGRMDDQGQIFIKDMSSGKSSQLTHINEKILAKINLGEIEEVWFKGPDNNDLQGWILKPPGFDPSQKYPSIMEIHGGPLTQYGYFFMHEFYYLASQGYVVYFCNPRGGRGYGEKHAGAIWGGWGGADFDDLEAWADLIASKPYIDVERMGVTGGSYGGYMTVWIIGHTQRYKAAVTQRCVSNLVSMWGSSDFNWIFQQVLGDEAPFQNLEKFWKHSPIAYIGNAKTPTLVIHSEMDLRCPIEQGEQVFVALKRLGVDSEMVRFPEEFHGLSRGGRTDRRITRLNHILRWFDKYLKPTN